MFSIRHFPLERQLEILRERRNVPMVGYRVPMKTDEEAHAWQLFQESDKGNPIATNITISRGGINQFMDIDVKHPLVIVLTKFALGNLSDLYVKAGVSKGLCLVRVLKARYLSLFRAYLHELTLEVKEHGLGERGRIRIYSMRVETLRVDGTRTLVTAQYFPLESIGSVLKGEDLARYLEERSKEKINEQPDSCNPSPKRKRKRGKKKTNEAARNHEDPDPDILEEEYNLYESGDGCYDYRNPLPAYANYKYGF